METKGTIIAAKERAKANSFTNQKRQRLIDLGMALIQMKKKPNHNYTVIRARVSKQTKDRFVLIAKKREQTESAVARDAILDYMARWEKNQ